jgi:hypothetical protein
MLLCTLCPLWPEKWEALCIRDEGHLTAEDGGGTQREGTAVQEMSLRYSASSAVLSVSTVRARSNGIHLGGLHRGQTVLSRDLHVMPKVALSGLVLFPGHFVKQLANPTSIADNSRRALYDV